MQKHYQSCTIVLFTLLLAGCSPEVGSDDWCTLMADKEKGDWTTNEVTNYAKHCLF
tara:strand:+ start:223 stop:390 length:168 start_codon:yes stop_codon:yes gene_type:complete